MKHILLAVGGETPSVITEAIYALKEHQGIDTDEVHILTTGVGKQKIVDTLLCEEAAPFSRLCAEYGLKTRFDVDMIHVFKGRSGELLEDVRTEEDNRCVRDQTFDIVRDFTDNEDVCLHGGIAGGRKSMSFFLGAAFNFFRRTPDGDHPGDHLYHVLVSPPQIERAKDFFYIPMDETCFEAEIGDEKIAISSADVRIELAELPCISVRRFVSFGSDMDFDVVFANAQHEIQHAAQTTAASPAIIPEIPQLIGDCPAIRQVRREIGKYAPTDISVLIHGETGTGKEVVAKALARLSSRGDKLVTINCGALPDTLVQVELFGSVKGAFTDARDREGAFRRANNRTIFLDEIGELSLEAQTRLLRVLQNGEVQPLGSDSIEKVDVRIIAATHRDLKKMAEEGKFRFDLYYRLGRGYIELPPLRERRGDIQLFIDVFLAEFNREYGKQVVAFDADALAEMLNYNWPGNVRELRNLIEQVVVSARSGAVRVHADELPTRIAPPQEREQRLKRLLDLPEEEAVRGFQRLLIEKTLEENEGVLKDTSKSLGRTRQWLDRKISEMDLKGWVKELRASHKK